MPDEIKIKFSADTGDATANIDKVNKKLGETTKESKSLAPGLENAASSLASFMSQNAALIGVLVGVGAALKDVIDSGIEYAMTVDAMARTSGQSAEEASRFIQVLDDYEISAQDAMAATKALTNNGLTPSIDTLAKLADQYQTINSAQERNEFIIKNLGRGGLAWAKALEQGGDALREQAAAIDENLILTGEQVQKANEARLAIDAWNDSIDALKMALSMDLLPWLTKLIDYQMRYSDAMKNSVWDIEKVLPPMAMLHANIVALTGDTEKETKATQENNDEKQVAALVAEGMAKALEEQAKAAEVAAKALSDTLSGQISLINNMQSAEDSYTQKSGELAGQRMEAEAKLAEFRAQGYWEQSEQIQSALTDIEKIKQSEADLAAEREKQTLQFISNILAEQLARDGWTQAEFDAFAKQQEAWGLWSADVVTKAQAAWQEADRVAASINAIPDSKSSTVVVTTLYNGQQYAGGDFQDAVSERRSNAGGGSFTLPYRGNESYMLPGGNTVSGGETMTIQKAGQSSRTDELLEKLLNKQTINEGRFARSIVTALQMGQA